MAQEIALPNVGMAFGEMQRLADAIAKSSLFGIKTAEQALVLMAISQAEGRHPALAARDYDIISGRPAKKAEAMLRDFFAAGGKVEWHAITDTLADATFSHPQGGTVRIAWDMERAKRAGLEGKENYRKYSRAMLRSRTVSEGVRTVWPMATSGLYAPEEAADFRAEPRDITPISTAAALDSFAKVTETVDRETGEVRDIPAEAKAAASAGRKAFVAFYETLTDEQYALIEDQVDDLKAMARAADRPQSEPDEDPFGLRPLGVSLSHKGADRNADEPASPEEAEAAEAETVHPQSLPTASAAPSLAVAIQKQRIGAPPDWERTRKALTGCVYNIESLDDVAAFRKLNLGTMAALREGDREKWEAVNMALADKERVLRGGEA